MEWVRLVAEEKIREAQQRGEFDRLPGFGKPLALDDLSAVPEDLRAAYRLLRNAGMLPEEMQLRKEMVTLEDLIRCCRDESEKSRLKAELSAKRLRFRALAEERGWHGLGALADYGNRLEEKLTEDGDGRD
jgi:hypothetical protein